MEVDEQSVSPAFNNSDENVPVGYFSQSIDWLYDLCDPENWLWIYDALLLYWKDIFPSITLFNVLVYTLKYVPTGIFTYNFLKEYYIKSRERLKRKRKEIEDLKRQVEDLNQNLKNKDYDKYRETLHLEIERIGSMREQIHEYLFKYPELRNLCGGDCSSESYDLDDELLLYDLLKDLNCRNYKKPSENIMTYAGDDHPDDAELVQSSASENEMKKDCQVKIIKVTNIYKVAYLKNYIKQKRMRRANKQSEFNKKMDNVKNMLDEWKKMLSIIDLRNKVILNSESNSIDAISQEAVADHLDVRYVNSQVDIRPSTSEFIGDYDNSWCEPDHSKHYDLDIEEQDCECNRYPVLDAVTEETTSQMALIERASEEEVLFSLTNNSLL